MTIIFVNSTKQDTWQDGVGCEEGTWDEHGMKEGREKEGGVYEILIILVWVHV